METTLARLPALVDAITAHDPRGRPTIAHIARQVRNAGLIESTKRGAGAAKMTFRDAAILVIGAYGDTNPAGAVEAVERMRAFTPEAPDTHAANKAADLPSHFTWLRDAGGFAETLEKMIERAPGMQPWAEKYVGSCSEEKGLSEADYSMRRAADRLRLPAIGFTPAFARAVRVVFHQPALAAEIHLGWVWRELEEDDAFHQYYAHPDVWTADRVAGDVREDNLITMEVGLPSLLALHHAVAGT